MTDNTSNNNISRKGNLRFLKSATAGNLRFLRSATAGNLRSLLGAVLFIIILTWGCSSDECLQNRNALPLAGFYNSFEPKQTVTIDSLEVYGIGAPGDSILSPGTQALSKLYLPFRLDSDTTRYVFRYLHKELAKQDIRDTVTFIYSRDPRFVSSACGVSYVFDIKKIATSGFLIDSVTCPMGEITNMDTENLNIYFRVSPQN